MRKKIISTLVRNGSLTKRELSEYCGISWGTVVHNITSLLDKKMIVCAGTDIQGKQKLGKTAYTYTLNPAFPLFLGIDVEYSITTIVVVNQRNEIIFKDKLPTQVDDNCSRFCDTLYDTIKNKFSKYLDNIRGMGIGIPRWLFRKGTQPYELIEDVLKDKFSFPVKCQDNVAALTHLKQFEHFHGEDFIALSIREGIGLGIVYNNTLISSKMPWFSQIGHIRIDGIDSECICGKSGCIETEFNQKYIITRYIALRNLETTYDSLRADFPKLTRIISNLFQDAYEGDKDCQNIINDYCHIISTILAPIIISFGIPSLLVTGNFGETANYFVSALKNELTWKINSQENNLKVIYTPLLREGFARGASLIIMNHFFERK